MNNVKQLDEQRDALNEQLITLYELRQTTINDGPDGDEPIDMMYYTVELQEMDQKIDEVERKLQNLSGMIMKIDTYELQRDYERSVL